MPNLPTTDDTLICAENVSKKFCRDLKRSLWYGVKDSAHDLFLPSSAPRDGLRRHEFWANRDISFRLRRGERIGLMGGNGAGKTTLLKLLSGLIKPDLGRIRVRGRVGSLIALGAGFNPVLTGRENVFVNASILGYSRNEIKSAFDDIVDFAGLSEMIDAPVRTYSSGMQVRLGFAVASSLRPDILLVDEVLAVGDTSFQARCYNRLGELQKSGVAFLLVSHNIHHIQGFCQSAILLDKGKLVDFGETSKVVRRYANVLRDQEHSTTKSNQKIGPNGNGKIQITSISTHDKAGLKRSEIQPAETIQLSIELDAKKDQEIELDCVIYQTGIIQPACQFTNTDIQTPVTIPKGKSNLTITLPQIPSNATTLRFAIAIWSPDRSELMDWSNTTTIDVTRANKSSGMFWLPASIAINRQHQ